DPRHEADVEVQERSQQRRPVARLLELGKLHCKQPHVLAATMHRTVISADGSILIEQESRLVIERALVRAQVSKSRATPLRIVPSVGIARCCDRDVMR